MSYFHWGMDSSSLFLRSMDVGCEGIRSPLSLGLGLDGSVKSRLAEPDSIDSGL